MLRYEWKKMLFYRRGLLLILVFLLAELSGILWNTKPYDSELEANRNTYNSYLSHVEGPLTPKKREWLEKEMLLVRQGLRGAIPGTVSRSCRRMRGLHRLFKIIYPVHLCKGNVPALLPLHRWLGGTVG